MGDRFTSMGKEVLRNGQHFADTNSNQDAADVADAMNFYHVDDPIMPEIRDMDEATMPELIGIGPHAIRREGDEYVCKCGVRWGTDEGDDHP